MKQPYRPWLGGLCALTVMLFVGCTGEKHETPESGSRKELKLVFVTNVAADFWTIARRGTERAEEQLPHVQAEFRINAEGTAAAQKRIMDDLLVRGVDGIAISPVDPDNQIEMLNQAAMKTLVITQDSDAPGSRRVCYIGTDNYGAGRQAGQMIKAAIPNGGKIMVFVGKKDQQNAKERFRGIQDECAGTNIEIIDVRTDDADRVRAKANVVDTMVKYPDMACLVGLWSYNGPAILNAVKEANKVGKVRIVCFDEEAETLAGVREGAIFGTVVQQPYEFGYQAIHIMAKILDGDRSMIPEDKRIIVPTLAIQKDNVDEFSANLKKLLGK